MKRTFFSFSLISLLFTISCSPDKELEPALTKQAIIGDYIVTAITAKSPTSEWDVSEYYMEDCERDDVIHFKADLTFEVTDDGIKCNPPTSESGPWDIINDHTIFLDDDEAEVKKWDGKELHFARPDIINGQDVSIIFKLRKL